jgi:protocatechuate 3,4-dioxygenase beta subunit
MASLVARVVWSDGSPAGGLAASAILWGGPNPFQHERNATTDEAGTFRMNELSPGPVTVYLDRGEGARADLVAGEETTLELEIAPGIQLRGQVVDSSERPIGSASIWLSSYGNSTEGHIVTETSDDGTFEVRDVGSGRSVAARAPGFSPSAQLDVSGKPGQSVALTLILPGHGGALVGHVRDPRGHPVEGARILVGLEGTSSITLDDGSRGRTPPPVRIRTDATGSFNVQGLAPGPTPIAARSPHLAPWVGNAEVVSDLTTRVDITLEAGAAVTGCVRDSGGSPAEGIWVSVGRYGEFTSSGMTTSSDGTFRLEGLSPGTFDVRAFDRSQGEDEKTFALGPGQVAWWDATLSKNGAVSGYVLDHRGLPLEGWRVGAVEANRFGSHHRSSRTDPEGRFTLENFPQEGVFWIEVREADWKADPAAIVKDYEVGGSDIVIRIPEEGVRSAWIRGRLLDEAGQPVERSRVVLQRRDERGTWTYGPDAETGAFEIGPLQPRLLRVYFDSTESGKTAQPDIELSPGETVDLGVITLRRGGRVQLTVIRSDGAELQDGQVWCSLWPTWAWSGTPITLEGGSGWSDRIQPGTHTLRVEGSFIVSTEAEVRVQPGQDTSFVLTVDPAVSRALHFLTPIGNEEPSNLHVTVRDESGRTLLDKDAFHMSSRGFAVTVHGCTPGLYAFEASTEAGLLVKGSFEVEDLSEPGATIRVKIP